VEGTNDDSHHGLPMIRDHAHASSRGGSRGGLDAHGGSGALLGGPLHGVLALRAGASADGRTITLQMQRGLTKSRCAHVWPRCCPPLSRLTFRPHDARNAVRPGTPRASALSRNGRRLATQLLIHSSSFTAPRSQLHDHSSMITAPHSQLLIHSSMITAP
jgi:hypothetical protein